ncbi:MAG: hypothetical protein V3T47_07115, partial [Gammaproteobacteria bacterium]
SHYTSERLTRPYSGELPASAALSQLANIARLPSPLFFLSAPIALLFFNVGGEIGQLFFIAGVFAVVALARRVARPMAVTAPTWAWAVPPCFIGSVSAFWVFQRLAAF